jgi:hypothetical protein
LHDLKFSFRFWVATAAVVMCGRYGTYPQIHRDEFIIYIFVGIFAEEFPSYHLKCPASMSEGKFQWLAILRELTMRRLANIFDLQKIDLGCNASLIIFYAPIPQVSRTFKGLPIASIVLCLDSSTCEDPVGMQKWTRVDCINFPAEFDSVLEFPRTLERILDFWL